MFVLIYNHISNWFTAIGELVSSYALLLSSEKREDIKIAVYELDTHAIFLSRIHSYALQITKTKGAYNQQAALLINSDDFEL